MATKAFLVCSKKYSDWPINFYISSEWHNSPDDRLAVIIAIFLNISSEFGIIYFSNI